MLLALVLTASGVSLLRGDELAQKPQPALKAHLLELDGELDLLRQSLALTGGDVFLKASSDAAPFVALAGVPALLLGFVVRPSNGTSGAGPVVHTGAIIAGVLLGTAVLSVIFYGVGRMIMHAFDLADWGAREKNLTAYRPRVVSALATAPPP
jgi:hypothetical protein